MSGHQIVSFLMHLGSWESILFLLHTTGNKDSTETVSRFPWTKKGQESKLGCHNLNI